MLCMWNTFDQYGKNDPYKILKQKGTRKRVIKIRDSSLNLNIAPGADRIVLWVTLAYAREYVIQHYAYAPVTKRDLRELSRYSYFLDYLGSLTINRFSY